MSVYLRFLFWTVLILLAGVATLNFVVDPGGIYRQGKLNPESYAAALIKSKVGLSEPEGILNDRLVAKSLAKYSGHAECVVIGSSHVMQISSDRTPKSLQDVCGTVLNLGVSAAGIEDHFTLAYLALLSARPRKIILGIDPWTLAYGKDHSWSAYRDDYFQVRAKILGKKNSADSKNLDNTGMAKLANLINLDYTVRSVQNVIQDFRMGDPQIIPVSSDFDTAVGSDVRVRLKDGSIVYTRKYISEANRAAIPIGGVAYLTMGMLNQQAAVDAYRALLVWIIKLGVEPILLMTPYHENVWKAPLSANTVAMRATEPIVMNLAQELNVTVIGSYDPKVVGCQSNEFYDFMHPKADCVAKLRVRE